MTFTIILAYGVCRFDKVSSNSMNIDSNYDPKRDNIHYFKGVHAMLKENGFIVYHSRISWEAEVNKRTEILKKNILKIQEKHSTKRYFTSFPDQ